MKTAARNRKHGRSTVLGKEMFIGNILEWVQRGFLSERKGKIIPCLWTEDRKGAGTNSGESGARNLEAESIRSGAKSTGGRVKLKTVTEIRRSSARDTFIAESVYLVLNSLFDWETVEKLKQGCDMVSFTLFFSVSRAAQYCMRRRLWTEESGRPERRELQ